MKGLWPVAGSLCLLGISASLVQAATAKGRRAPSGEATATREKAARPDRALYEEAVRERAALQSSRASQARRSEWERVVMRFRRVVARYPQSGYCDNALLAVGDLYREMARRFKATRYNDDAVQAYQALVTEYPSSRLGEEALFSAFEIAREGGEGRRLTEAGRIYLATFPDSRRAAEVKALVRRSGRIQAAALPRPPPPGLVQVFNLRFWSGESSTRVVFDLEKRVPLKSDRIADPDRLWVDLLGTRLHPNLRDRSFPVGDGLLEQIRIGQNRDDVVRVVLDFKDVKDHTVFYLEDPTRLVVDVRGAPRPAVAGSERPALPPPADMIPPRPGETWAGRSPEPWPTPTAGGSPTEPLDELPSRRVAGLTPPDPPRSPPPSPRRPAPGLVIEGALPPRRPQSPSPAASPATGARGSSRTEPSSPLPPQVNRAGSYSLARQLGLGARKIVIDPGHGGHDPGSIGPAGLQEKDLVLDVALRLEKLVRHELEAEVLMTRSTDLFIPLEERTAIANSKGADLFLSIHANSSRSARARGIETYFLSFATDPHAEAVAARENAISAATLKDLQNLVRAIALNTKIDESRDFAASVQEAMVTNLKAHHAEIQDRGVRTAPFYVLIGANMPSVLAEIAFLSHPGEEKLLKTPDHRERIARSLLEGVRSYLDALDRTRSRQLTGPIRPSTVAAKEGRR